MKILFLVCWETPGDSKFVSWKFCSKQRNMRKGSKHDEASPTADKIIFNKVADVCQY